MIQFQEDPAIVAAVNARHHAEHEEWLRSRDPRPVPERMAEAMRELAFAHQSVDEEALQLAGFTAAEIAEHGASARALATARSIRRAS